MKFAKSHFCSQNLIHVREIRFPVTSYNRHFIFWVTSYQREKWSLHTRHFIPVHYIPWGTSYQSLHTKVTSYQSHFIQKSLHTETTSYQGLLTWLTSYHSFITSFTPYRTHFILVFLCRTVYIGGRGNLIGPIMLSISIKVGTKLGLG